MRQASLFRLTFSKISRQAAGTSPTLSSIIIGFHHHGVFWSRARCGAQVVAPAALYHHHWLIICGIFCLSTKAGIQHAMLWMSKCHCFTTSRPGTVTLCHDGTLAATNQQDAMYKASIYWICSSHLPDTSPSDCGGTGLLSPAE